LANLFCRGTAAAVAISFINVLTPLVAQLPLRPVESAVAFHSFFNIATGLFFCPLRVWLES
jgi:Na+/phosphate symporter